MACRSRLQVGRERTSWCRRSLRGFSSMLDAAVIGRSRSQADVSLKLFGTIRTEPCRKRTANRTRRLLACRALISHFYYSTRHTQPAPPPPRKGTVWGGNTTPELQAMTGMTIASAACTPQRAWSLPRQRRNFPQLPSALYVPSFHNFLFPSILELFFFLFHLPPSSGSVSASHLAANPPIPPSHDTNTLALDATWDIPPPSAAMLLRFRGPDGMIRQEAEKDETFGEVMRKARHPRPNVSRVPVHLANIASTAASEAPSHGRPADNHCLK